MTDWFDEGPWFEVVTAACDFIHRRHGVLLPMRVRRQAQKIGSSAYHDRGLRAATIEVVAYLDFQTKYTLGQFIDGAGI